MAAGTRYASACAAICASQQQCVPKDNKTLRIRKAARPEPWQQVIYQALDLPQNPGGGTQTIIID